MEDHNGPACQLEGLLAPSPRLLSDLCSIRRRRRRRRFTFHQLNKATGNRLHFQKVDAETGDIVPADEIIKGYEVGKGNGYVEVTDADRDGALFRVPLGALIVDKLDHGPWLGDNPDVRQSAGCGRTSVSARC